MVSKTSSENKLGRVSCVKAIMIMMMLGDNNEEEEATKNEWLEDNHVAWQRKQGWALHQHKAWEGGRKWTNSNGSGCKGSCVLSSCKRKTLKGSVQQDNMIRFQFHQRSFLQWWLKKGQRGQEWMWLGKPGGYYSGPGKWWWLRIGGKGYQSREVKQNWKICRR